MKEFQSCVFAPRYRLPGVFVRSAGHYILAPREERGRADYGEIFWAIEGNGIFRLDGKDQLLMPEHLFYYPPGSSHDILPQLPFFHYRWLTIEGTHCGEFFSALGFEPGIRYAGQCPEELFSGVELALQNVEPESQRRALNIAVEILTSAMLPRKKERSLQEQIKRFIDEHYHLADCNVSTVAQNFHLHRITLCHLFQQQYGIAPSQYIASLRLQKGIGMLTVGREPIKEIAGQCGFASIDYFSKKIRQTTGMNPRQLRQKVN